MIDVSTQPWMNGLLGDAEMAAIFAPERALARFLRIEAAWTRALGQVEGIKEAEALAAQIETAPIVPRDLEDGMAKDGVPIPALVRRLKAHVGADALLHRGLTSQDVLDTSLMQSLVEVLNLLAPRLATFDRALHDMQNRFGDCPIPAFTRMQPALETTGRDVIGRWRQPLARMQADVSSLTEQSAVVQWGGPIGARDHPQAQVLGALFAQDLSLRDPGVAWHTDRTRVVDVANILARIATTLGKMGEDIALYAVTGSGQHIAFEGGGSSAMPHKSNPIKAEALCAIADHAASLVASVLRAARHEGHRSGRAWTLEWLALPQLCLAAGASSLLALGLVGDIKTLGEQR